MSMHTLKHNFSRLDKTHKIVGIGSVLAILSIFMPWYEDLDAYNIGDRFFGISGPTMLIGIFILAMSALVFWTFYAHLRGKRPPKMPVTEHIFNMFAGAQSFFLLIIVNSIFFHSKFGVNITLKESKFGMTVAFIGTFLITLGGYLQMQQVRRHGDIGRLEPLINLEEKPRNAAPISERINVQEHRPLEASAREMTNQREEKEPKPVESKGSYTIRMDL